ncbi:mechanosensitive ion channel domain-containing protein [Candidatus Omnitrophota bacterium]
MRTNLKRVKPVAFIILFSLYALFSSFCLVANAQVDAEEKTKIEAVKKEAEEVKIEVEAAKKETEVQKKTVELEKKKAEVKVQEAEVAKKEVEAVKETSKSRDEIKKAIEKAELKEKEAKAAIEKVKITEEKLLATKQKALLAEEELKLARERAEIAELKLKKRRNVIYRKSLQTGAILALGYLLILLLVSIVNRRIKDLKIKHVARKNITYLINFIIILSIIYVWIHNVGSIAIFISAISAGIVFALQEVILCIAGWFLIFVRKPFGVGDRIELGGVKGDVIDIRLFQTSLLEIGNWVEADQSTGRIVNVPNSAIFKQENYNYNRGFEFIWNEIKVLVTFESDWKKAKEIMLNHGEKEAKGMEDAFQKAIQHMTRHYMIHYEKMTPIVYVDIKDSGVGLTLRYLTEAKNRRFTQDRLSQEILNDFEREETISFAYPTYRIVK